MARIIYPLHYNMQFRHNLATRAKLEVINTLPMQFQDAKLH